MQTPVMLAGHTTGPSTSAIRYSPLTGGVEVANWTTSASNAASLVPVAGTLSNLIARFPTLGAGSYIITIMKNGVAQTLTCTPDLTGTGIASDAVNSFTVAAGDLVAIRCDPNGTTPTANANVQISMLFTATVSGESFIIGGYVAAAGAGNTFFAPMANMADTTAAQANQVMPCPGVIDRLYYRVSAAPGAGKTRTLEVIKNGTGTGVIATIADAATTGSDLSNTVSVAAGDLICLQEVSTGTPTNALYAWGARFVPTTSGESVMPTRWSSSPAASTNRFSTAAGSSNGSVSAEANVLTLAPVAFVARKLYIAAITAPGGATTRDVFLRQASASSALTAQLFGTAVAANDTTHSVNVASGDLLDFMVTSSASVTATASMRAAAVAYIAPVAGGSTSGNLLLLGVG